jgi:FKBP-type peptidyl-prolyl cis-trans isomerase
MNSLKKAALVATMAAGLAACETRTVEPPAKPAAEAPKADAAAKPADGAAAVDAQGAAKLPDAPKPADAPKHDPNDPLSPPEDVAAPPADGEKTVVKHNDADATIVSKVIKAGTGTAKPAETDIVEVHYTGWTIDGKMFDSSIQRGQTIKFPLDGVIPGWREAVKLMVVGEKRRVWIPEELAYKGVPGAPQGMLVFEIELLNIIQPPKIDVPEDVAAVPKKALKTPVIVPAGQGPMGPTEEIKSVISSRVLTPGTGKAKPTDASMVKVHYSGWTTDGKMFDSSVKRGEPVVFPLGRVIPGWRETVKLMVVGEKRRVWIPEELAYKNGPPGAPKGMLVFDIELIEIMDAPPMPQMPPGHGAGDGHGH